MHTELLEERKNGYCRLLAKGMPPSLARNQVKATWRDIERWKLEDPDFSLAVTTAMEDHTRAKIDMLEELEYRAMASLATGLEDDPQLALQTLAKIDQRFNPAQIHQVEGPKHRFIGFDGKNLHEDIVEEGNDGEESDSSEASG